MKKITSMMLLIGICQFGFTATDSLKRKSDVHTFSMNGEYSTSYLNLAKLNKSIPAYIIDMSYDKWTSQEERTKTIGLIQKHINDEKMALSFPLIIQKKNKDQENISLGHLNKQYQKNFSPKKSTKDFYVTLIKKKDAHYNMPIFDLYISKLIKTKSEDGTTAAIVPKDEDILKIPNFNFGKLLFQSLALSGPEQNNSCIIDVQSYMAEFNSTKKIIRPKKQIFFKKNIQINNIQITNNMREPGNFEFSLLGNIKENNSLFSLLKGYVHFPYPFYNTILKSWIGKTPIQYGIAKDRLALKNTDGNLDYFSFTRYEQDSPFKVNTLPTCHIRNLKPFVDNSDKSWTPFDLDKAGHQEGSSLSENNEMSIFEGKFSFADFPIETQQKMAWKDQEKNSYLFIKVNKKHAPGSFLKRHKARGYKLPAKYFELENSEMVQHSVKNSFLAKAKSGREFWSLAKKHKKSIFVPHRFDNYQEMFGVLNRKTGILEGGFWTSEDPNILTSSIEADGRYGANQNIDNFKAQRLWPADLNFVQRLSFYDAFVYQYQGGESSLTGQFIPPDQTPRIQIKLSCLKGKKDLCKGKIHNLVVGNISLKPGERKEVLPGIGVEPTEVNYNKDSLLDFKAYALTYNKQGYITDHFPEIGKVIITRGLHLNDISNPYHYTIDIISNDRIHVLSRTILNLKKAHIDFERKKVLNSKTVGLK